MRVNGWSTHALLLPYLEQVNLFSTIDFTKSYKEAINVQTADGVVQRLNAMRVPTYLCPSERRDEVRLSGGQPEHYPLNYGVNLGVWLVCDPGTDEGGIGSFYPESKLKANAFGDGLAYTLCAAEVKAWQPYFRNAALPNDPGIPAPEDVATLGGEFKSNSGHTEWVDGRAHQVGFTTTFRPNTLVPVRLRRNHPRRRLDEPAGRQVGHGAHLCGDHREELSWRRRERGHDGRLGPLDRGRDRPRCMAGLFHPKRWRTPPVRMIQ